MNIPAPAPLLPAALFLCLTLLLGCSDAFHPFPPESTAPRQSSDEHPTQLAQGYTPCNDEPHATYGVICHPNQYCSSQMLAICHQGCLSEDNCTENQLCIKNGRDVGTCISEAELEANTVSTELDPGYTACGTPGTSRFSICHPSQYCESDYFGSCSLGCLSEDNCTENQFCDKTPGAHLGTCQPIP